MLLKNCIVQRIVASELMVTILSWCGHERGPLFVLVFNPLMLLLVALDGSLVLNENLFQRGQMSNNTA